MWQKGFVITIGFLIGIFSAPLCLDTTRLSHGPEAKTILSWVQVDQNIRLERG